MITPKTSDGRRNQIRLKLVDLRRTAMLAGDISLTETPTQSGKSARKGRGGASLVSRIDELERLIPAGEITAECWHMFYGLLIVMDELVDASLPENVRRDVEFAERLHSMCIQAADSGYELPAAVAKQCEPRTLKPKAGTMGGVRDIGGAAALAWGYYVPPAGTSAKKARMNAGKQAETAIDRARRSGIDFVGLGRR